MKFDRHLVTYNSGHVAEGVIKPFEKKRKVKGI